MEQKDCYRQGDVILVPVSSIPEAATRLNHLTLAEGELTGHAHRVTSGDAMLFEHNENRYLDVRDSFGVLTHEEHKPVTLPAGHYQVVIQVEYRPEGWTRVSD